MYLVTQDYVCYLNTSSYPTHQVTLCAYVLFQNFQIKNEANCTQKAQSWDQNIVYDIGKGHRVISAPVTEKIQIWCLMEIHSI